MRQYGKPPVGPSRPSDLINLAWPREPRKPRQAPRRSQPRLPECGAAVPGPGGCAGPRDAARAGLSATRTPWHAMALPSIATAGTDLPLAARSPRPVALWSAIAGPSAAPVSPGHEPPRTPTPPGWGGVPRGGLGTGRDGGGGRDATLHADNLHILAGAAAPGHSVAPQHSDDDETATRPGAAGWPLPPTLYPTTPPADPVPSPSSASSSA